MTAFRFTAVLALGLAAAGPALAGASLVVDASTGDVLSSENATQAWRPASTAKMMTIYLALKAVREGRIGLETAIPASKRAASQPRVKVYIKPGQEITLDNALRIRWSSRPTTSPMSWRGRRGECRELRRHDERRGPAPGMRDTRFMNPNGWDNPDQVSAHDLAVLPWR